MRSGCNSISSSRALAVVAGIALITSCVAPPRTSTGGATRRPNADTSAVPTSEPNARPPAVPAEASITTVPAVAHDDAPPSTTTDPAQDWHRAVVRIRSVSCEGVATGSGFLVDGGTMVITARHVVEGASEVEVETWDGQNLDIGTVRQGHLVDLGVVSLRSHANEPSLNLASDGPTANSPVFAVGYPEGNKLSTVDGSVLGYFNDIRYGNLGRIMRFSAAIKPGNSGGPLTSADGLVVGVVYAIDTQTNDALAVPVDSVRRLLAGEFDLTDVEPC